MLSTIYIKYGLTDEQEREERDRLLQEENKLLQPYID